MLVGSGDCLAVDAEDEAETVLPDAWRCARDVGQHILGRVLSQAMASSLVRSSGFRSMPPRRRTSSIPIGSGLGPVTSQAGLADPVT